VEQLTCGGPLRRDLLGFIASNAGQLRELSLKPCIIDLRSHRASDIAVLKTASGFPRLPRLTKLWLPNRWLEFAMCAMWHVDGKKFTEANQQVVAAYSAQLTSLSVTVITSSSSLSGWIRLLFGRGYQLEHLSIEGTGQRVFEWEEEPEGLELERAGSSPGTAQPHIAGTVRSSPG
jgi:hypothetical protein